MPTAGAAASSESLPSSSPRSRDAAGGGFVIVMTYANGILSKKHLQLEGTERIMIVTWKGGIPVGKSSTDTCCLTLPLKLEKWQEDRLAKRFEIARQIYNTLVHAELKKLERVKQLPEYRNNQKEIQSLDWKNQADKPKLKKLYKTQSKILQKQGFTEYSFKSDIKYYYKHFGVNIGSSVAVHGIASQVWNAFDKMLFQKDGKVVHFKKHGDVRSLKGASVANKSGGAEIMFRETYIEWKGLKLPLKLSPDNAYETEMLSYRVKYVRILRKRGKTKDHWYAQLSLEGKPVIKRDSSTGKPIHPVGKGAVGLDIGPQTLAYAASNEANLVELADRVQNIEQEKRRLQRKLDRSRRATNPDNYDEKGMIRRGVKLTHNKSKRYCALQKELSWIQHYQAETRRRQHIGLANHLLSLGDCFYVEDMEWPALTHRAKKTEVSPKTGKIKRKKRFGKSIANKAPASLIGILKLKCIALGLPGVEKVPTSLKASQYNHQSGEYTKKALSQRWNDMPDGKRIQRDLYSAFLLQHYNLQSKNFDQETLNRDYPQFVRLHDQTIERLSTVPKTPSSMGIRRSVS